MKIIKNKKKRVVVKKDSKKESLFKGLSSLLQESGYEVRREPLKQGHGWRVLSGSCQAKDQEMIFVDRKMSQDDQINFLITKIVSLKICPKEDRLLVFPERIQNQLSQKVA